MMKYILFLLVVLTFTRCKECDFSIPNIYGTFLHKYNVGDTIYFESNLGNIDTMLIAKYDTLEECGQGFMTGPRKHLIYEIKHLPQNSWTRGREYHQNGSMTILNQDLVVVEKSFDPYDSIGFFTYINYREFGGEIFDINQLETDSLFLNIGVAKYWKVMKSNYNHQNDLTDSIIHNVYWSAKFGLTGYEYGNGEMFKIKN
jgi:hypothetical protein